MGLILTAYMFLLAFKGAGGISKKNTIWTAVQEKKSGGIHYGDLTAWLLNFDETGISF